MPPIDELIKKLSVSMLIGLVFGVAISEIPFLYLKETARPPQVIELTIPPGTAEKVSHGEQPPEIPENMIFVVGDTLMIHNEDLVDHKLGPLWIPAQTSAQLSLDQEESIAYQCSFQPGKYFGLDVHEPLTMQTRIIGITFAGVPMGILIALYSFVIPTKKKNNAAA